MLKKNWVFGNQLNGEDVRMVREMLNMSRREFSEFVHCSLRTVENWEGKTEPITGPVVPLLELLFRRPEWAKKMEVPPNRFKLRIWYMYRHITCTIIDVDELAREVEIHNYIENPMFRAFGRNSDPTFEEYESFLESRCFPASRDKMKLELRELGLPFYDPIMIIEKNGGRMADDHFWLRLER